MSGGTFMYAHRHVGAEDQAPHYLVVMLDLFSMVVESAQLQQLVGPCGLGKASLAFLTSVILPAEQPGLREFSRPSQEQMPIRAFAHCILSLLSVSQGPPTRLHRRDFIPRPKAAPHKATPF